MNSEAQSLWHRLSELQLDEPGVPLPFSKRLAEENGWHQVYADRVIEEYKKFLFLASIGPRPVTPSKAVDQAWHLHLTYSRSYWETLCPHILQKPLHHNPTTGDPEESGKFSIQFQETLTRYVETFGSPPAEDIWGKPNNDHQTNSQEVEARGLQKILAAPNRTKWGKISIALFLAGLPISIVLAATTEDPSKGTQTLQESFHATFGWLFTKDEVNSLMIVGIALVVGLVFLILQSSIPPSSRKRRGSHGNCGGCTGGTSCGSSCGGGGCGGGD